MASVTEKSTALQDLSREQWLLERRKYAGSSDAGPIVGCCPWRTALEVYFDKLGQGPEWQPKPHQKRGLQFQHTIAQIYAEETGREFAPAPSIIVNSDAPWMAASMDYVSVDRPLEIKRVNQRFTEEWGESNTETIPAHYYLQVQQQMACGGYECADLAAFIGWDDFRVYTIGRNQSVIDNLIAAERDFMDRVMRRDPPMPDFSHASTLSLLNSLDYEPNKIIELGDEFETLTNDFQNIGETKRHAEKAQDEIKARLLHAMGDAELAYLPDGRRLQRKIIERAGYSVQPGSYIKFSVLKAK